ncbi:hypothetical protein BDV3_004597 [Batrachochytrium dendrobatidis]
MLHKLYGLRIPIVFSTAMLALISIALLFTLPPTLGTLAPALVDSDNTVCRVLSDGSSECYPMIFQATHEFQPIRPEQQLPKGLHIRINVATGLKEAKLVSSTETEGEPESMAVALSGSDQVVASNQDKTIQLQSKPDEFTIDHGRNDAPIAAESVQKEAVKKTGVTGDINKPVLIHRPDGETHASTHGVGLGTHQLSAFDLTLKELQSHPNHTTLMRILDHLDNVVSQIDYGIDFAKSEYGIPALLDLMRGDDLEVREHAVLIISSAMSNNPQAQEAASRFGLIYELWKLFELQTDLVHQKRFFSAFGVTIRSNVKAILSFSDDNGFKGLSKMVAYFKRNRLPELIKIRILSLFGDMIDPDMFTTTDSKSDAPVSSIHTASADTIKEWCKICSVNWSGTYTTPYKEARDRGMQLLQKQGLCPS